MRSSLRLCVALLAITAGAARAGAQACTPPVDPIRNTTIKILVSFSFSYTPKDESEGRAAGRKFALEQLDSLGLSDGNTFVDAEGVTPNLYFNFNLNSDDQDRYTGSAELAGWGQGHIVTKYRTDNSYSNPMYVIRDLLVDLYSYIHTGWYDNRPQCRH